MSILAALLEGLIVGLADAACGLNASGFLFSSNTKINPVYARTPNEHPYGNGKILTRHGYHGEVIYDTSDPLPDHDLLISDIKVSPIDDHVTCGC